MRLTFSSMITPRSAAASPGAKEELRDVLVQPIWEVAGQENSRGKWGRFFTGAWRAETIERLFQLSGWKRNNKNHPIYPSMVPPPKIELRTEGFLFFFLFDPFGWASGGEDLRDLKMTGAKAAEIPGTACSSSREAVRSLSLLPKWFSRAFFLLLPTPGISSNQEWRVPFLRSRR